MTAITHSLYERYVLKADRTRLDRLRHLLAPAVSTTQTKPLPAQPKPGYTEASPLHSTSAVSLPPIGGR
jgi:hypothetical protein